MTQFSLEDGTQINADHVISYAKLRNGTVRFTMVNEDTILGNPYDEDFEEAFYPIIAAQPGYETVFARKRGGVWFYNAQPVVAWRECPGAVLPIHAFGKREPEEYVGTKLPDGKYVDIMGDVYSNIVDLENAYEAEQDE